MPFTKHVLLYKYNITSHIATFDPEHLFPYFILICGEKQLRMQPLMLYSGYYVVRYYLSFNNRQFKSKRETVLLTSSAV